MKTIPTSPIPTDSNAEASFINSKSFFGFWIYLMTDLVLFATLFATFAVLRNGTFEGPSGKDIFNLPYVLVETIVLLISSYTAGLGTIFAKHGKKDMTYLLFGITFALGLVFLGMELHEFNSLASEGNSWQRSAFLSSFFTLVGTHGLHITAGLVWMSTLLILLYKRGFSEMMIKRLMLMSLFWHFLDIVWIFIFTFVFLLGVS